MGEAFSTSCSLSGFDDILFNSYLYLIILSKDDAILGFIKGFNRSIYPIAGANAKRASELRIGMSELSVEHSGVETKHCLEASNHIPPAIHIGTGLNDIQQYNVRIFPELMHILSRIN